MRDARDRPASGEYVEALARGLDVIQAFSAETPEMTLTEVAHKTGLSPATARRFLLTLRELGFVASNGRRFVLRSKCLLLGSAFLNSINLRDIAEPWLQDAADAFHDASSLAVLEGDLVVYVAHVPNRRAVRYRVWIGSRHPAFCTSLGQVLLSGMDDKATEEFLRKAPFTKYTARTMASADEVRSALERARREGYSAVQDQLEYGSIAIAVPVMDPQGRIIAAINCSTETSQVDMDTLVATRLPVLRRAAGEIAGALRRHPALVHSIFPETGRGQE
jgi:IclR family pca regulon transcriptional regulator